LEEKDNRLKKIDSDLDALAAKSRNEEVKRIILEFELQSQRKCIYYLKEFFFLRILSNRIMKFFFRIHEK